MMICIILVIEEGKEEGGNSREYKSY